MYNTDETFGPKTLVRFGDIWILHMSVLELTDEIVCLIEQTLDDDHLIRSLNADRRNNIDSRLFFIGVSKLNFCKLVSAAHVQFETNYIFEETPFALLNIICAIATPTLSTDDQRHLHELLQPKSTSSGKMYHNKYTHNRVKSITTTDEILHTTLMKTKLSLGKVLLLMTIRWLLVARPNIEYIALECDGSLLDYYEQLGFSIGSSPFVKFTASAIRSGGRFVSLTGQDYKYKVQDQINSYVANWQIKNQKRLAPVLVTDWINPNADDMYRMHYTLKDQAKLESLEMIVAKHRPNLVDMHYVQHLLDTASSYERFAEVLANVQCFEAYLDGIGTKK